jgi:hypothetical protein
MDLVKTNYKQKNVNHITEYINTIIQKTTIQQIHKLYETSVE